MKPSEHCASIEDVRQGIDMLDHEIIALIGRRAYFVEAAARFKTTELSAPVLERQKPMLEGRHWWLKRKV